MIAMTIQTVRELLAQRPFKPFRLVMSSGQSYEIRHPEMAMLTRTDMLVGPTSPMTACRPNSRFAPCCMSPRLSR
jgi:hypothetical protein